ncbi:methylated-DNA--[protein]-cysteine S-methyltransferase [Sphingomonas japonica]|nr:methylated-DNA--[protein]-cysteine S-methyltransferase [Sphingomonas japonica]
MRTAKPLAARRLSSPIGTLTLVARDAGLAAVLWPDDAPTRVPLGAMDDAADHPILDLAEAQLTEYFRGERTEFTVPLDFAGTAFQRQVWAALLTIPFGQTRSYAAIAAQIGRPTATRAVGAANGRNPISILAPCHRVIGASGKLTGFAGGLGVKKWLLAHESSDATFASG